MWVIYREYTDTKGRKTACLAMCTNADHQGLQLHVPAQGTLSITAEPQTGNTHTHTHIYIYDNDAVMPTASGDTISVKIKISASMDNGISLKKIVIWVSDCDISALQTKHWEHSNLTYFYTANINLDSDLIYSKMTCGYENPNLLAAGLTKLPLIRTLPISSVSFISLMV